MKIKIACLNEQGCNDLTKRECVGRLFEERGLDVLVKLLILCRTKYFLKTSCCYTERRTPPKECVFYQIRKEILEITVIQL